MALPDRLSGFLLARAHEAGVPRDHFESLVVKRDYPVSESLPVDSRNVSLVYLISPIKVGDERRVLNYVETVKSQPVCIEWVWFKTSSFG